MRETYQQKAERLEECKCEDISQTVEIKDGYEVCCKCGGVINK